MEPNQSIDEETSQSASSSSVTKPREEMSLDEIAAETGGYLIPISQTVRHDS